MKRKRILVFGGSGSLGKQLLSRLGADNVITVFSRDEAKHWEIRNSIPKEWYVDFVVGDMRDYQAVERAIKRTDPDTIIIASALKQVDTFVCANCTELVCILSQKSEAFFAVWTHSTKSGSPCLS